jgi:diacylglycerol kinase family enzyme
MRVMLVHNPKAGDDDHEKDELVELLRGFGHEVDYRRTKKREWKDGLAAGPELVVVAGGDGTVSEVAKDTAGTGMPVTILPAGTANNIAGSLGLVGISHEDLVRSWTTAELRPFDLGVASGGWGRFEFLESVGTGVLADLMDEIENGGSGYVNELESRESRLNAAFDVLLSVTAEAQPVRCELRLDGHAFDGEYLLVEVLNFGAAGPNLHLAPDADGSDGQLDVVLVEARHRSELLRHLESRQARPLPAAVLQVHHARELSVHCEGSRVHLDDELWTGGDGPIDIDLTLRPGALTFLVPSR